MLTNWKKLIQEEMDDHGESWGDVESSTLSNDELIMVFDNGYGGAEGSPFTIWTQKRVYFPVIYDGAEWCSSVSRNPDGIKTRHVGGV